MESAILVLAIELSDGSLGNIISRGHRNVSEVYVYHCNLCRVVDMVGEKTLMYHIAGDVHQTKLRCKN